MPTQITKIELNSGRRILLRVEGEMLLHDAELIERIVRQTFEKLGSTVIIDLADLDFLDSEAASILRRLEQRGEAQIDGIEIFLQTAVDMAERV